MFEPAEIHDYEQQISEFIQSFGIGLCGFDFIEFLSDLIIDSVDIRPVESDFGGFLGNAVAAFEFRSALGNIGKEIF